jgi:hypothetical protein
MITLTGSSAFKTIIYFEKAKKLIVEYNAGSIYSYNDVEMTEVAKLSTDSKGSELHTIIKDKVVNLL